MENTTREKRKNTFVKKGALVALALVLAASVLTACDESDGSEQGQNPNEATETGDFSGVTVEESPGHVEAVADFYLGPLLEEIDFVDLLISTEGQEKLDEMYNKFLDDVKNNPEIGVFNGEQGNFFRELTTAVGEKRHNVMFEVNNVDNSRWTYILVSTKDDFAVVARDLKKKDEYIVGFMDGEVVDEAGYLTKHARAIIHEKIMDDGYDATMNQVRDEFFGQLLLIDTQRDEDYLLELIGKICNMTGLAGRYNPPEERYYVIKELHVIRRDDGVNVTTMDVTYDIPDNYLGTQIGN